MKQKKNALASLLCSIHGDEDEEANNTLSSTSEGEPSRTA